MYSVDLLEILVYEKKTYAFEYNIQLQLVLDFSKNILLCTCYLEFMIT